MNLAVRGVSKNKSKINKTKYMMFVRKKTQSCNSKTEKHTRQKYKINIYKGKNIPETNSKKVKAEITLFTDNWVEFIKENSIQFYQKLIWGLPGWSCG